MAYRDTNAAKFYRDQKKYHKKMSAGCSEILFEILLLPWTLFKGLIKVLFGRKK
ncbi:MAG: hypothetical protein IJK86_07410 [Lachnospiraceae bacterium]|nr:hypothetical protein [Lachnospiraceae bacterium]